MTNRIQIDRLIVKSQSAPDAILQFQAGLNVISGPSDSGKSFVLDLISFMFGSSSLRRRVPEIEPYDYVIMQMTIKGDSPEEISIARSISGDTYELRQGHVDLTGLNGDPRMLSKTHNHRNLENLSNYFLDKIGLAGALVRRNARNQTRTMSIRDIAHLAIIDETSMQSEVSPVTPTNQFATATVEESVFSVLIEGEDFSGLSVTAPSADEKRLSESRARLLDTVVAVLGDHSPSSVPLTELNDQLDRLATSIASDTASLEARLQQRDEIAQQKVELARRLTASTAELAELSDLYSRFLLLSNQYASDLERLAMIGEAGTLLTLSNPAVCVLCGAATEHQRWDFHKESELTALGTAVDSERSKIERLASDLRQTLQDVRERGLATQRLNRSLQDQSEQLALQLRHIDAGVRPERAQLRELLDKRSAVERTITVQEQIRAVDALRAQVAASDQAAITASAERPSSLALVEFCTYLQSALQAWHVQGASPVRYDRRTRDFIIGGRARASRGKGVRALQHAAFSIALVRYCADRQLPAPGFVVLDSPLVTYREPDRDDPVLSDDTARTTSEAFYDDLSSSDAVQIIVIENVPPPARLNESINHVAFTLNPSEGRVGLFPHTAKSGDGDSLRWPD